MNKQAIKREFLKAVISGDRATAINLKEQLKGKPIIYTHIIADGEAYQIDGELYTAEGFKVKITQLLKQYDLRFYLLDVNGKTDTASLGMDQPTHTEVTGMQIC